MRDELTQYIEHTLLRPDAVENDYVRLCRESVEHGFFGVCVPPCRVRLASSLLAESGIRVVSVVGFPLGFQTTAAKVYEAENALAEGAHEIDMVINIGALKEKQWHTLEQEIGEIVRAAEGCKGQSVVKVIIETCYLTDEEKRAAVEVICSSGANFVKTSTGFGTDGATVEDVELLHKAAGGRLGVKAAGGIRTREQALVLVRAGASRLGTSRGPALVSVPPSLEKRI